MIRKFVNKQWKIMASGFLVVVLFILLVAVIDLLQTREQVLIIVYLLVALLLLLSLLSILLVLQSDDGIAFQNAAERYGLAYESLDVKWIINSDGSAIVNREIEITATYRLDELDTFLAYGSEQTGEGKPGEINRAFVEVESLTQRSKISVKDIRLTGSRLSALLGIVPPLTHGQSMTYRMRHQVPKGFYTIFRDSTGSDPNKDYDHSGWTISRPTRNLHLRVYLPTGNVKPEEYDLHVLYASASDFPTQRAHYEEGARAPQVELRETDQERYLLELSIDYPVTGLVYVLRWLPPLRSEPPSIVPTAFGSELFSGIDSDLIARIRRQLTSCGPFESDRSLRDVFLDRRINGWLNELPQANAVQERVDALMMYLFKKSDTSGQNGLVIFLRILSQKSHPIDACKDSLAQLETELEHSLIK